jgi:hypothetical protein
MADGWGRAVRGERGAREMGRVGHERGRSAGARERGENGLGRIRPNREGEKGFLFFLFIFVFYFLFLNPFFFFKQIFI